MNVNKHERPIFCDIDETLVLHGDYKHSGSIASVPKIAVDDPLDSSKKIWVTPHAAMIRLLEEEHYRGAQIWVWSRGGAHWAANVIKALKIEHLVHEVMTKPLVYFDDKPAQDWLQYRVYIDPKEVYKGEGGFRWTRRKKI